GMGEVYLAENVEDRTATHVALKVIKLGMDSRQVVARFQLEQEALQKLNHPGIASFIESGVTKSGRACVRSTRWGSSNMGCFNERVPTNFA
ncbi:MAG: hypothetical protein ABL921_05455, partial [Pirellula sp.]